MKHARTRQLPWPGSRAATRSSAPPDVDAKPSTEAVGVAGSAAGAGAGRGPAGTAAYPEGHGKIEKFN